MLFDLCQDLFDLILVDRFHVAPDSVAQHLRDEMLRKDIFSSLDQQLLELIKTGELFSG